MDKPSLQESDPTGASGSSTFDQQRIYPGLIQGDQVAWAEFYDYFSGRLDTYFKKKVRLEQDREELLQETMTAIFSSLDSYNPDRCPLQNWVYGVARNVMVRQQDRVYLPQYENESGNYEALGDLIITTGGITEDPIGEDGYYLQNLRIALKTLPDLDQQILKLRSERDGHHVTFADIGQELGIPSGTARMRHKRACDRLRKAILDLQSQPEK